MWRALTLAVLVGLMAAPAAGAQTDYTIKAKGSKMTRGIVLAIGSLSPQADPALPAATAAFGNPSSRKVLGDVGCRVGWSAIGLRLTLVDLGSPGSNPCETGKVQTASVFGKVWRTSRGLRIGQSVRTLRRLYPGAVRKGRTYRLIGGKNIFGTSRGRYSVVAAKTNGKTVKALKLDVGSAGE